MTTFAIYIPSVYQNITESMISKTFHRMEVGKVKHVELISQGKTNKAHVYFTEIYDNETAANIACGIKAGDTVKLNYARNEHVFWILLQSRREYDGKSNIGEFVEETNFTQEEISFMESHMNPDVSLVDSQYAVQLENEIFQLRNTLAHYQMNNEILHNNFQQQNAEFVRTSDVMMKWLEYGESNQMDRLRRAMFRYMGKEIPSVEDDRMDIGELEEEKDSKMDISELEVGEVAC